MLFSCQLGSSIIKGIIERPADLAVEKVPSNAIILLHEPEAVKTTIIFLQ